jgi:hypothetical protein
MNFSGREKIGTPGSRKTAYVSLAIAYVSLAMMGKSATRLIPAGLTGGSP